MKLSKKWIATLLVCSQFLTALPVSATIVISDDLIESSANEEQSSDAIEVQESQPNEVPEEMPEETENLPVEEEVPVAPEVPEEIPEESTPAPKPEGPTVITPPTEESQPAPTPKPDQSNEQEPTPDSTRPVPVENQRPSLPMWSESNSSDATQTATFEIAHVKETWDFIKEIGEDARKIGLKEDLYASVMIAQAILESSSGQSKLSQSPYHNLFGIKGTYDGKGVTFTTQEDDGSGNLYTIEAMFRQYENYEASMKDYANLLKEGLAHDSNFYKGAWKSETESFEDATEFLTGRYATDTQYGEKLNALIKTYALTSFDKEKAELSEGSGEMIHPVKRPVVSSLFGSRWGGFHRGVDFAAPIGTPIIATLAGIVIRSEYHDSWGNYIAIEHENGMTTLYAHNNQNLVTVGQKVDQGEVIASMGSTGNSTGPHLHFEVSLSPSLAQDQLLDPMTVLPK
ncbi:N-acetylmuramoyl-L-alanine amidase [Enterococcus casseliflavus]|nr:N-acetylmuramoyl-L-alanine amidase [Enterococcus casseliflavus]